MGWSTPRTWTDGEVTTATMHNAHLRDNLGVLKVTRDDNGRISALAAATLADLSSANITGLARAAAANTFTAGMTRFLGTSRCVLPVGADKYESLGGGLRRGVWIEGDYLHHIAANQTSEWRYLGTFVSTPAGAVAGSCWVEGAELHYIDADGDERRCPSAGAAGAHTDTGAIGGSFWTETYNHWIQQSGSIEKPGHADVAHSDGTSHSDTHSDVAHHDSHADTGFSDSHSDVEHFDTTTHGDSHNDRDEDRHGDSHSDFGSHADTPHSDTHSDVAHGDDHSDTHTDVHADHNDHGDVVHSDQPTVVP
jgi:hypothetical protein